MSHAIIKKKDAHIYLKNLILSIKESVTTEYYTTLDPDVDSSSLIYLTHRTYTAPTPGVVRGAVGVETPGGRGAAGGSGYVYRSEACMLYSPSLLILLCCYGHYAGAESAVCPIVWLYACIRGTQHQDRLNRDGEWAVDWDI